MARTGGETTTTRRGRRPGVSGTRHAVLDAARAQFAREGFAATTIRGVADAAGVDAALVMQFFGSKQELFAAVMSVPSTVLERLDTAFDGSPENLGERVVRAFLDVWEGVPADAEPLMAMLRGAVVHEPAREQLRGFVQARLTDGVIRRASGTVDDEEAALRTGVASSMLLGLVLGRRIIEVPTLAGADREELVGLVAPAIHGLLTGQWRPAR